MSRQRGLAYAARVYPPILAEPQYAWDMGFSVGPRCGYPVAAGALYPSIGALLSPIVTRVATRARADATAFANEVATDRGPRLGTRFGCRAALSKERAPALRAHFPLNHFAGIRRLEKATSVAALCTFRLILVRDRVLTNLALCGGKIRSEDLDDRTTNGIGRHTPEENTS
jgi:hypothetical protein